MDGSALPPPVNSELEQALLAAILIRNGAGYDIAREIVQPSHFAEPVHGRIFDAIGKLIDMGRPATGPALKNLFDQDGALETIGGAQYLARLAGSFVTTDVKAYAEQVWELHILRELIQAASDIALDAAIADLDRPAGKRVEDAAERISGLLVTKIGGGGLEPVSAALSGAVAAADRVFQANGKIIGVPTGLIDLDRALTGLQPTDLVIVAGRPGMGKTALATGAAEYAAKANYPVAFFSLEMAKEQLASRILAGMTGISAERQRGGPLTLQEMEALIEAQNEIANIPLYIDDNAAASVAQLKSRAKRLARKHGLALIVVDYLQLLVGGNESNRVQEVSKITRDLKVMAKELKVPVMALSQLSRAVESRDDKRPMLSDLRELGLIEQDADVVMFCYREEYYLEKTEPQISAFRDDDAHGKAWSKWRSDMDRVGHKAEILVRKNRHGREPTVILRFDGARTRFENFAGAAYG